MTKADPVSSGASSSLDSSSGDCRLARLSGIVGLAVVFAGVVYSRESGFVIYALLFSIPYISFFVARSSPRWQGWGFSLAWVAIGFALIQVVLTTRSLLHRAHHSDVVVVIFLCLFLLTQVAMVFFVRRAFPGWMNLGTPLLRCALYYLCLLILVGATLPNWYVPPTVRGENKAVVHLKDLSAALSSYAAASKDGSYPPDISALVGASRASDGYRFEYRPVVSEGRVVSFTISARPLEFEETGKQSFLLAADRKIYQTRDDREARLTDAER